MNVLAFAAALFIAVPSFAAPATTAAAATVAEVSGGAEVLLDGVEPWTKAAAGQELTPGSKVRTSRSGSATLLFFDGSKVRISRSAEFTLESAEPAKISLFLAIGKLEAWVSKLKTRNFQTRTPSAVAAVRGTVFEMDCPTGKDTTVDLFSGSLAVNDNFGHSSLLAPGQSLVTGAASGAAPKPVALPPSVKPPVEPTIALAPAKPAPAPATQTAAVPPPLPVDTAGTVPPPPPPPNPAQNTAVASPCSLTVSPSTPCP
jgi:hypothetical protein